MVVSISASSSLIWIVSGTEESGIAGVLVGSDTSRLGELRLFTILVLLSTLLRPMLLEPLLGVRPF